MIQRIQTIYLLAASLLFFFMLNGPLAQIVTSNDLLLELNYLKLEPSVSESFEPIAVWPLTALLFSVMTLGIVAIFFFKKRTIQMRLCMFNILLMFGLVGMVYYYAKFAPINFERDESVIQWPIVVPFISIILTYLAIKAIQKDEALVKSWERLR
jgi:hypothetical protein